jgi:hypothetical protein
MPRLLRGAEVAALTSALTLSRTGAGKPRTAVRPMAVAALTAAAAAVMARPVAAAELLVACVVAPAPTGLPHREIRQRPGVFLPFRPG